MATGDKITTVADTHTAISPFAVMTRGSPVAGADVALNQIHDPQTSGHLAKKPAEAKEPPGYLEYKAADSWSSTVARKEAPSSGASR